MKAALVWDVNGIFLILQTVSIFPLLLKLLASIAGLKLCPGVLILSVLVGFVHCGWH